MQGQSDSKLTNKTEFQRYLDSNPNDVPCLSSVVEKYQSTNPDSGRFGFWLRQRNFDKFNKAYRSFWLNHPELYGKVYAEPALAP